MPVNTLRARLLECSRRQPDRVAIEYRESRIRYRELERRSALLGSRLAGQVEPGSIVVALVPDPVERILALTGILHAGCVLAPLDPSHPPARLRLMMEQCRPAAVVVPPSLQAMGAELCPDSQVLVTPQENEDDEKEGRDGPGDLLYIYFTSGSTGVPKAVAGSQRGLLHFLDWEIRTLGLGPGTRASQLTPATFDPYLREVFAPLCAGGTLCIPHDHEGLPGTPDMGQWLARTGCHLVNCVPRVLRSLAANAGSPDPFPSLEHVLVAGEPLYPADLDRWCRAAGERAVLRNLYGPTETTLAKFCFVVRPADRHLPSRVPVGKPIEGARALVLDSYGDVCPDGQIGEIYIRTPYRSLGYYKRPDLTAEVFVPNPFSSDPNDLIYKTGDLGRVLPDGNFELVGRRDNQVKIYGVRVEPGEIESHLRAFASVTDAAVIDREDTGREKTLVAYLSATGQLDPALLRVYLSERLPAAMIPGTFVQLDELPRNLNGKVDRKALRELEPVRPRAAYVEPRTELERKLVALWQQALGVERLGVQENVFDAGAHSLIAMRVFYAIRHSMGVEVPVRVLFEAPTVEKLALAVAAASETGSALPLVTDVSPSPAEPGRTVYPLSPAQENLWLLDRLQPNGSSYNHAAGIRILGALDIRALRQSLTEILRRHEALRAIFPAEGDSPVQVIVPGDGLDLPLRDLSTFSEENRLPAARAIAAQQASAPFDLARGPLYRTSLLKLGEQEHVLLFNTHHIVSDAWSVAILIRELTSLYQAYSQGLASPLPELPVQFGAYALRQRSKLQGEYLEAEIDYWKGRLAGAPPLLDLPFALPRPAAQSFRGATCPVEFPAKLADSVAAFATEQHSTRFMVLMAALQALLHRYTGYGDIVVGAGVANRGDRNVEALIGCFMNTVALRTDVSGDPTFVELLARTRETSLDAYAHQELPFEKVVGALQPERDLSYNPLVQVMLVFQEAAQGRLDLGGLTWEPFTSDTGATQLDLTLLLLNSGKGITGSVMYAADLFDRATVERLIAHFRNLLEDALARPGVRISELDLMGTAERSQLLEQWAIAPPAASATCRSLAAGRGLHQLFEMQARLSPEAVAIISGQGDWSFAALDRKANQLAHALQARGLGLEDVAGVFLDRSPQLVAAILAAMKAGAAYIPLEAAQPAGRLSSILRETAARIVITESRLLSLLPPSGAEPFCLDAERETLERQSGGAPAVAIQPDNLAYVIYTSGSTGQPKGVAVRHAGVVNNIVDLNHSYTVGPGDAVLALSAVNFDMSVYETLGMLAAGGTVVMPDPVLAHDPAHWMDLMVRHRVSVWNSAPALLEALLAWVSGHPERRPSSLRLALLGGDWVPVDFPDRLRSLAPDVRVIVLGGATEASIHSVVYPVGRVDSSRPSIPYGRPMANQAVYVLDANLRPVPIGVHGEIYLGGDGLARGYCNRPDLTAERFVPSPFATGGRLYRTGDRARWLPDGNLELLGRMDFQVKLRGIRIELGEIESQLRRHPAIRECCVLSRPARTGAPCLVAFVSCRDGAAPAPAELRGFLKQTLPEYMTPRRFVHLLRFPLSPNGKVDRRRLSEMDTGDDLPETAFVPPETPLEKALAILWSGLLQVDLVGLNCNFFSLGGHSLLAIRLLSQVREGLAVEIPLRCVFESPSLAEFARAAEAAASDQRIDVDHVARMFLEVEAMPGEQVRAMLSTHTSGGL